MENVTQKLKLEDVQVNGGRLVFEHSIDKYHFQTSIEYEDLQFDDLRKSYDPEFIQAIIVQIGILSGIKYCSLAPKYYDCEVFSKYLSKDFVDLFSKLYKEIFAQHRYENNLIKYEGPVFQVNEKELNTGFSSQNLMLGSTKVLLGCGGGKDSLVAMKLLDDVAIPYSCFQYSYSIYGEAKKQHELIDELAKRSTAQKKHKIFVEEDFLGSSVLETDFKDRIDTFCDAETPNEVFQAIPIMLKFGYKYVTLGHEKSADSSNFFWEEGGQEVNHQWGKTLEAENLLNAYVTENLISNFSFFSILKPIYDHVIFKLARTHENMIKFTHSCNVKKPWCKKCPKCAYVWLNLMAYCHKKEIDEIFHENLFNDPELKDTFLEMMGYKNFKPFECIGEIGEVQLAMIKCKEKGFDGELMEIFTTEILPSINVTQLEKKYQTVYKEHNIPKEFAELIIPLMKMA